MELPNRTSEEEDITRFVSHPVPVGITGTRSRCHRRISTRLSELLKFSRSRRNSTRRTPGHQEGSLAASVIPSILLYFEVVFKK